MSFVYPEMLAVAGIVCLALLAAYHWLQQQRSAALGLVAASTRRSKIRRHLPPMLFLAALTVLLAGAGRPQATVPVPRAAGTVVLAFDVSNSMGADDVKPTRLAAAQAAAINFIQAQPDSVDVGVVAFDQGALTTRTPGPDHDGAVAAVKRLNIAGGTSIGSAILGSLATIVGHPVTLPDPNADGPPPNLGYWGSATIVLLSDGEDTGGPDAEAAAALAADAGVHIETIGVGTVAGTTITVDGYQVATALNEDLLHQVADITTGSYHKAENADELNNVYKSLNLRITTQPKLVELTGAAVVIGVVLLMIGGLLMISWFGRIL
jgi:Ca-activated chloride channel family protein